MNKQLLLNTFVNNLSLTETISEICHLIDIKSKSYVVAINIDVVVKIESDHYLKQISDDADLTLVDGIPLVWISKWFKRPVKEKVSGSDLVPALCNIACKKGYSLFLIGGADGVAEKAKLNLERLYKGINIVGTYSPPYGFEKDYSELSKINNMISSAHPDIVIACFGCPKQEKWIYENYLKYDAFVSICAGATVDFLAGNVSRAPKWISRIGLEWFYRFLNEPKRLFKRYFIDDLKIIKIIWKYLK